MSERSLLQARIRAAIPLSDNMQFSIDDLNLESIRVSAPLEPNVNIHGTGFAGSIYSLAILTGWAWCDHLLTRNKMNAVLVVGNAEIRYRAPLTENLTCFCSGSKTARDAFIDAIKSNGKGKLALTIEVGKKSQALVRASYTAIAKNLVEQSKD